MDGHDIIDMAPEGDGGNLTTKIVTFFFEFYGRLRKDVNECQMEF